MRSPHPVPARNLLQIGHIISPPFMFPNIFDEGPHFSFPPVCTVTIYMAMCCEVLEIALWHRSVNCISKSGLCMGMVCHMSFHEKKTTALRWSWPKGEIIIGARQACSLYSAGFAPKERFSRRSVSRRMFLREGHISSHGAKWQKVIAFPSRFM